MPKTKPVPIDVNAINKGVADSLARRILKLAKKLSNDPVFMAEFEAWQEKRKQEAAVNGTS